jgi:uncharacterized OB-fold protein
MKTYILKVGDRRGRTVETSELTQAVPRVLPPVDGPTGFFWRSGRDGVLRFLQCEICRYVVHPPAPFCPRCQGRNVAAAPVCGRGTLYSYTVNHQPWDGVGDRYVVGIVELDEQPGLRLTTNIVDVDPETLRIGMPVEVTFEDHDPVYLPLFRPVT